MSIKIAFLAHGTLLGDFEEKDTGSSARAWEVSNPVIVISGPNQLQLYPFLAITDAKSVVVKEDDLRFGDLFDPAVELRNHYSSQFGSGIQLRS